MRLDCRNPDFVLSLEIKLGLVMGSCYMFERTNKPHKRLPKKGKRSEVNKKRRIRIVRTRSRRRRRRWRIGWSRTEAPESAGQMGPPAWRQQLLRQPSQGQSALPQQPRHNHNRHHPRTTFVSPSSENSEDCFCVWIPCASVLNCVWWANLYTRLPNL